MRAFLLIVMVCTCCACVSHAMGNVRVIEGDTLLDRTVSVSQDARFQIDTYSIKVADGQVAEITYGEYSRRLSDFCGEVTVFPTCSGLVAESAQDEAGAMLWRVTGPAVFTVQVSGTAGVLGRQRRWDDDRERYVYTGECFAENWSASVSYLLHVSYDGLSFAGSEADLWSANYGGTAAARVVTPFWNPSKRVYEGKVMSGGDVFGTIRITAGKATRGKSRVSAEIVTLMGKRYVSDKVWVANNGANPAAVKLMFKRLGPAYFVLGSDEFAGQVVGVGTVERACFGRELASARPHFRLQAPIRAIGDQLLETDMLPMDVSLEPSGSKFVAASGVQNPSDLWLCYNKRTGKITGTFKAYGKMANGRLRTFRFKVRGLVIDGIGYLKAYHLNGRYETSASLSD